MENESGRNLELYFFKCEGIKKYIQSKRAYSTMSPLLRNLL